MSPAYRAAWQASILPGVVSKCFGLLWKHFASFPTAKDWSFFSSVEKDDFVQGVLEASKLSLSKSVLLRYLELEAGS